MRIIRVGDLLAQSPGYRVITLRVIRLNIGWADNDFGTHRPEEIDLGLALFISSCKNTSISTNSCNQGKSHSGIARGSFDNGASRLQNALLFSGINHLHSNSVSYAPPRSHPSALPVYATRHSGC